MSRSEDLLNQGKIAERNGQIGRAIQIYNLLIANYPDSDESVLAKERKRNLSVSLA